MGTQETAADQLWALTASGAFASWPSPADRGTETAVLWRVGVFEFVEARSFPVRFLGQVRPQAVVLLRHRVTGRLVWVVNVHLAPKRKRRDGEAERDAATVALLAEVARLRGTGVPVLVTGDMNEHEEIMCKATAAGLLSANGGAWEDGRCRVFGRVGIDWIFGSAAVQFGSFAYDKTGKAMRVNDHPAARVWVTIPGQ